jgi:hypothetical protein
MSLTRETTLAFRALKRTAVVLMLVRYLDKPVGEGEIAAILDMDPKTARAHLRSLASLGLLTRLQFHRGYQLTHAGRQMALPMEGSESCLDPVLLAEGDPVDFPESSGDSLPEEPLCFDFPVGEAVDLDPTCTAQDSVGGTLSPVGPSEPGHPFPHDSGDFPGSLIINTKVKDSMNESINNNNYKHHPVKKPVSSELPLEKHPVHQMVVRFLGEHGILINDRTRRLLGKITCDDILSVANNLESQGMLKETGLFVVCLEQRVAQGLANWQEVYGPPAMEPETLDESWDPDEIDYSPAEAVQDPGDFFDFDGPPEIEQAWCAAVEQVCGELSQVTFKTWLAPAIPLAWEAEKELLTVGVVNSYARDWLDKKAKGLLLPYLVGILKSRVVQIEFVVIDTYLNGVRTDS